MHITLNLNRDFALLTEKTKQKTLAVLIKGSHMRYIFFFGRGKGEADAAQSEFLAFSARGRPLSCDCRLEQA